MRWWFLVLVIAVPVLHHAAKVRESVPIPAAWQLPVSIGTWHGENLFYSLDPAVQRVFRDGDLIEPGVCPVSGGGLDTVSPRERAMLPRDVEIDRRLYHGPEGLQRHVIMLVTGESREGIHRPDWCLVAQNVPIGPLFFLTIPSADGASFDVGVYPILARGAEADSRPVQYFVYWFEGGGARTPYHWSRILRAGWDRMRSGRAQRWAYFSIQMTVPPGVLDAQAFVTDAVQWFVGRPAR
ncbi:MAG: hypothetical protein ACNA71_02520 [Kiritimatiellia bacterium]